ncbi:hypothetical protein AAFN69_02310 [Streptomyces sp. CAU 1734]
MSARWPSVAGGDRGRSPQVIAGRRIDADAVRDADVEAVAVNARGETAVGDRVARAGVHHGPLPRCVPLDEPEAGDARGGALARLGVALLGVG